MELTRQWRPYSILQLKTGKWYSYKVIKMPCIFQGTLKLCSQKQNYRQSWSIVPFFLTICNNTLSFNPLTFGPSEYVEAAIKQQNGSSSTKLIHCKYTRLKRKIKTSTFGEKKTQTLETFWAWIAWRWSSWKQSPPPNTQASIYQSPGTLTWLLRTHCILKKLPPKLSKKNTTTAQCTTSLLQHTHPQTCYNQYMFNSRRPNNVVGFFFLLEGEQWQAINVIQTFEQHFLHKHLTW